jgi:MarR family transcriptional regulator for hemolysin
MTNSQLKGIRGDQEIERNVAILVADVYLRFRKYFNRLVRDTGLTWTQVRVLISLYRQQGLTQTELADQLDMGKSPVGKKLDTLEASGWVFRRTDDSDRRVKRVYLTKKLDQNVDPLLAVSDEIVDGATIGLELMDVDRLTDWLMIMRSNLDDALEQ